MRLVADNLKKVFNRRVIFERVSFAVAQRETLLVTGRNGSGKSTLVKIVSDVLSATEGSVMLEGTAPGGGPDRLSMIGLVSPYLTMYDEFTARENLRIAMNIRGLRYDDNDARTILTRLALGKRFDDPVRTYSSGMKQRVKYAFALVHHPTVLILDEPMSNLDADGIAIVREVMDEHRRSGILIVATNDLTDIETFDHRVDLNALS